MRTAPNRRITHLASHHRFIDISHVLNSGNRVLINGGARFIDVDHRMPGNHHLAAGLPLSAETERRPEPENSR